MRYKNLVILLSGVLVLSACSRAKEELGLTRHAPDEFAVVKRAPLAMPPDYTMRPPRPGTARPQEQRPEEQARTVIFGHEEKNTAKPASAEEALLQQAGTEVAQPGIREIVDRETATLEPHDKPVAKRLFGLGGKDKPPATVVDAKAEASRLRTNAEEGKPVTEGETPAIEE